LQKTERKRKREGKEKKAHKNKQGESPKTDARGGGGGGGGGTGVPMSRATRLAKAHEDSTRGTKEGKKGDPKSRENEANS